MNNSTEIQNAIQEATSKTFTVTGKVTEEISALLEATLGIKEMGSTEADKIAGRLIRFQFEQDTEVHKGHED